MVRGTWSWRLLLCAVLAACDGAAPPDASAPADAETPDAATDGGDTLPDAETDGGTPTPGTVCAAPPTDLAVPLQQTSRGATVHWTLREGCIPVSFAPSAAGYLVLLQEALAGWDAVDCSTLCFTAPTERATPPEGRSIHVSVVHASGVPSGSVDTIVRYDPVTGAVRFAEIQIADAPREPPVVGSFLRAVGVAAGLGTPDRSVQSVLDAMQSRTRTAPTVEDRTSLCRLYGPMPYCAD